MLGAIRRVGFAHLVINKGRTPQRHVAIIGTMVGVAQLGELEPKVQWTFAVQRTPDRSLAGTSLMRSQAGRRSAMLQL